MKIALTSVFVDDPKRAFAFHTDVLGVVEKMFVHPDPSAVAPYTQEES